MKKAFLLIGVLLLVGCGSIVKLFSKGSRIPKEDFSVQKNVVYYKEKPYAELQAMTWSLDGGELVREKNFKLLNKEDLDIIGGMIDFLSERHNGDEIEIEFNVEHDTERFKL